MNAFFKYLPVHASLYALFYHFLEETSPELVLPLAFFYQVTSILYASAPISNANLIPIFRSIVAVYLVAPEGEDEPLLTVPSSVYKRVMKQLDAGNASMFVFKECIHIHLDKLRASFAAWQEDLVKNPVIARIHLTGGKGVDLLNAEDSFHLVLFDHPTWYDGFWEYLSKHGKSSSLDFLRSANDYKGIDFFTDQGPSRVAAREIYNNHFRQSPEAFFQDKDECQVQIPGRFTNVHP